MANQREPTERERIAAELARGKFVKAVMKPTGKMTGTLEDPNPKLQEWLAPLRSEHYVNEDFAAQIHLRYPTARPLPPPPLKGLKGATSPSVRSFIYLDVGAWIGSKNKPWGRDASKPGRYLKRDFGLVCGPLVALCTYTYAHEGEHCPLWKDITKNRKEPWKSVVKLVDALSRPAEHEQSYGDEPLGSVIVRDAMIAPSSNPMWPDDEKDYVIHILLGDMHIPVLDDEIQTYGLMFDGHPNEDFDKHVPARVPRLGRLDIRRMETIVRALIGAGADDTQLLRALVKIADTAMNTSTAERVALGIGAAPFAAGGAAIAAKGVGLGAAAAGLPAWAALLAAGFGTTAVVAALQYGPKGGLPLTSDPEGLEKGLMSKADAKRWYEYYFSDKEGKPADIFEDAGDHVLHLALRLKTYMDRRGKDDLPVKFVQTGDMLDFWVGFTCHYVSSSDHDQAIPTVDRQGEEMVKHWTRNLFGHTRQGKRIAEAVDHLKTASTGPVFLYGNHDNYLGMRPSLTFPFKGNDDTPLDPRLAQYPNQLGLFAEHGHQWEPSNADNAQGLGLASTAVIGTPSPTGLFVTQAAYIRPEPTRIFDGVAAGLLARISGSRGQRLDQVVGAACRFVEKSGRFYCYAMGHTHVACLSEVVLHEEKAKKRLGQISYDPPAQRVYFVTNLQDFAGIKFVPRKDGVSVLWSELPGAQGALLALVDYFARPRVPPAKIPKGLVTKGIKGTNGAELFHNVPPGVYKARYYAAEQDEMPFATSHNAVGVIGLSIEEDPSLPAGAAFHFDEEKNEPVRPIILRWAFDPGAFDAKNAWFAIYRPDDPLEATDYDARQLAPGMTFFSNIMRTHPHWGRWNLAPAIQSFSGSFIARYGDWQIRAFNKRDSPKPMAFVNFRLVKATEGG